MAVGVQGHGKAEEGGDRPGEVVEKDVEHCLQVGARFVQGVGQGGKLGGEGHGSELRASRFADAFLPESSRARGAELTAET